jgi:hypothetical protein
MMVLDRKVESSSVNGFPSFPLGIVIWGNKRRSVLRLMQFLHLGIFFAGRRIGLAECANVFGVFTVEWKLNDL